MAKIMLGLFDCVGGGGGAAVAEELAGRSWVERWKATTVRNKTDAMAVPGNTLCNPLFANVNRGGLNFPKWDTILSEKGSKKCPLKLIKGHVWTL